MDIYSSKFYYGQYRYRRSIVEVLPTRGSIPKYNVALQLSGLKVQALNMGTRADPLTIWHLLLTPKNTSVRTELKLMN